MKRQIKYRPNKAVGAFGVVWGGLFVLIGLFVVIPAAGAFGVIWTLAALAITGLNAYQAFGKKYLGPEITIEDEERGAKGSFDQNAADHEHIAPASFGHEPQKRLEQLETLKEAGLISDEEYREKRKEIIREL